MSVKWSQFPAGTTISGSDKVVGLQGGDNVEWSWSQAATYIGSGLTVGSTTITSGTTTRILYDNAGVLGEYTISGSGTTVAMAAGASISGATITTSDINSSIIGGSSRAAAAFTAAIANSVVVDGATVPFNGMYLPSANTLGWAVNSTAKLQLSSAGLSLLSGSVVLVDTAIITYGTNTVDNQGQFGTPILAVGNTIYGSFYFGGAGNSTLTATHATGVGWGALKVNNANGNTAMGQSALTGNTTGSLQAAFGADALYHATTGGFNAAFGCQALYTNVVGTSNTGVGTQALFSATASQNTAVGATAGYYTVAATRKTLVGYSANFGDPILDGGDGLTAIGHTALHVCTGTQSTAVGDQAGVLATTAAALSLFGAQAGGDVTTGGYNTFIGFNTGRGVSTGAKNTIIGAQVSGLAAGLANTIILADGDGVVRAQCDNTGLWRLGAGVTGGVAGDIAIARTGASTTGALYMGSAGAIYFDAVNFAFIGGGIASRGITSYFGNTNAGDAGTTVIDNSGGQARFYQYNSGPTLKNLIQASGDSYITGGNVGIGTASPGDKLDIAGNLIFHTDNSYDIGASGAHRPRSGYFGANVVAGDTITAGGGATGAGSIFTGGLYYNGRGYISAAADGVFTLKNEAGTDFSRLQFGGTTSSFPALGRSGTGFAVQLADGTAGGFVWVGGVSSALTTLTGATDGYRGSAANVTQLAGENTSSSSASAGGFVGMYSNDGAAMASGDRLGGIRMGGASSASALRNSAVIAAFADEAWVDASAYGSRLEFQTTTNTTTTISTKASLSNAGAFSALSGLIGYNATATPAAASAKAMVAGGSALVGIYWGTGDPNGNLTAPQGSIYTRTDGGANTRLYVNNNAGTGWSAVTSA